MEYRTATNARPKCCGKHLFYYLRREKFHDKGYKSTMKTEASNPLKSVLDDCETAMKGSGNEYKRDSDSSLMIELLGKRHVMAFNEDDDEFLRITASYDKDIFEGTRAECLERVNLINQCVKVVKIFVDDDNDVAFSVEMFLDRARFFSDIFQRQIQTIDTGVSLLNSTDNAELQPNRTENAETSGESNWLNSVLDRCEQQLEEDEIPFNRLAHNRLLYTVAGRKIALTFEEDDLGYLSLTTVEDSRKFHCNRKKLLEVVNGINYGTKVTKAYINSDNVLVFSAEVYLNSATDFARLLRRYSVNLIGCMRAAIRKFNLKG